MKIAIQKSSDIVGAQIIMYTYVREKKMGKSKSVEHEKKKELKYVSLVTVVQKQKKKIKYFNRLSNTKQSWT